MDAELVATIKSLMPIVAVTVVIVATIVSIIYSLIHVKLLWTKVEKTISKVISPIEARMQSELTDVTNGGFRGDFTRFKSDIFHQIDTYARSNLILSESLSSRLGALETRTASVERQQLDMSGRIEQTADEVAMVLDSLDGIKDEVSQLKRLTTPTTPPPNQQIQ